MDTDEGSSHTHTHTVSLSADDSSLTHIDPHTPRPICPPGFSAGQWPEGRRAAECFELHDENSEEQIRTHCSCCGETFPRENSRSLGFHMKHLYTIRPSLAFIPPRCANTLEFLSCWKEAWINVHWSVSKEARRIPVQIQLLKRRVSLVYEQTLFQ